MIRLLRALPLCVLYAAAQAQTGSMEPAAELKHYAVEIIVFEYNEDVSSGTEIFVPESDQPGGLFTEGGNAEPPEADRPDATVFPPREVVRLSQDELTLEETWNHLQRLDVYRPMLHFGWTQAVLAGEQPAPQMLTKLSDPPRELSGELTLYLGRYLHLVVDLQLEGPVPPATNDSPEWPETNRSSSPLYYRINENRIFKIGDLRYFDHPKFGVLAKITRMEQDEDGAGSRIGAR